MKAVERMKEAAGACHLSGRVFMTFTDYYLRLQEVTWVKQHRTYWLAAQIHTDRRRRRVEDTALCVEAGRGAERTE